MFRRACALKRHEVARADIARGVHTGRAARLVQIG